MTEVELDVVDASAMGEPVLVGVPGESWVGGLDPRGVTVSERLEGGDERGDEESAV